MRADAPPAISWRVVRYAAGALLAIAALWTVAARVEWPQLTEAFGQASRPSIAAAVASVMVTLALVTVRWGLLVGHESSTRDGSGHRRRILWDAVVVGQAVNIVFPLRFGEGARFAVTTSGLNIPAGRVMIALALERAFDVAAFGAIVASLLVSGLMPAAFRGVLPAAAAITLATIAAAVLIVRLLPPVLAWLRRRFRFLARAADWIERQEVAMRDGWTDITRRHQLTPIAILTAVIPLGAATTNFLVFQSFNLPVPAIASLVLLVVLQIGTAVVSVPGNVGVFHYLTVVTLAAWEVPQPTAVAVAIVLHIVSLGPKVVLAAFSARNRIS